MMTHGTHGTNYYMGIVRTETSDIEARLRLTIRETRGTRPSESWVCVRHGVCVCVSGVAVVGGFNVWCSCVSVTGAIVTTGGRGGYGSFFFLGCCGCCVSVFKFQEVGQKRHSYQLCMYVPKLQTKIYINLYQCAVVECVSVLSGCWSHVVRTIFQQQQKNGKKNVQATEEQVNQLR